MKRLLTITAVMAAVLLSGAAAYAHQSGYGHSNNNHRGGYYDNDNYYGSHYQEKIRELNRRIGRLEYQYRQARAEARVRKAERIRQEIERLYAELNSLKSRYAKRSGDYYSGQHRDRRNYRYPGGYYYGGGRSGYYGGHNYFRFKGGSGYYFPNGGVYWDFRYGY